MVAEDAVLRQSIECIQPGGRIAGLRQRHGTSHPRADAGREPDKAFVKQCDFPPVNVPGFGASRVNGVDHIQNQRKSLAQFRRVRDAKRNARIANLGLGPDSWQRETEGKQRQSLLLYPKHHESRATASIASWVADSLMIESYFAQQPLVGCNARIGRVTLSFAHGPLTESSAR